MCRVHAIVGAANLNGVDAAGSAVCAAEASRVGAVADFLVQVVLVGERFCLYARNLDGEQEENLDKVFYSSYWLLDETQEALSISLDMSRA